MCRLSYKKSLFVDEICEVDRYSSQNISSKAQFLNRGQLPPGPKILLCFPPLVLYILTLSILTPADKFFCILQASSTSAWPWMACLTAGLRPSCCPHSKSTPPPSPKPSNRCSSAVEGEDGGQLVQALSWPSVNAAKQFRAGNHVKKCCSCFRSISKQTIAHVQLLVFRQQPPFISSSLPTFKACR